ncbi:hypothetical protein CFB48_19200 [Burkholderia sp. AU33647]|nr:hypothetical protein CFB48_19200 [Burkholderia sp. AU33647]
MTSAWRSRITPHSSSTAKNSSNTPFIWNGVPPDDVIAVGPPGNRPPVQQHDAVCGRKHADRGRAPHHPRRLRLPDERGARE